jgi:hypothetical protein
MAHKDLEEAKESLEYLRDAMQVLMDVGTSGELTLAKSSAWVEDVARTREMLENQREFISKLEKKLEISQ